MAHRLLHLSAHAAFAVQLADLLCRIQAVRQARRQQNRTSSGQQHRHIVGHERGVVKQDIAGQQERRVGGGGGPRRPGCVVDAIVVGHDERIYSVSHRNQCRFQEATAEIVHVESEVVVSEFATDLFVLIDRQRDHLFCIVLGDEGSAVRDKVAGRLTDLDYLSDLGTRLGELLVVCPRDLRGGDHVVA